MAGGGEESEWEQEIKREVIGGKKALPGTEKDSVAWTKE